MNLHKSLKKGLAVLLAAVAVGASVPPSVWMTVRAAEYDALNFYNRTTGQSRDTTTAIVEGSTIGIHAKKIINNIFDNPPFIVKDISDNDASRLFEIRSESASTEYTLLAQPGSSGAARPTDIAESSYKLTAVNITQKTSGDGEARKLGTPGVNIALMAEADRTIAVITDSAISFTTTAEQTQPDADGNSTIAVGAVRATGVLKEQCHGYEPVEIAIRTDKGVRMFDLNIPSQSITNPQGLKLRVEMFGGTPGQLIPAGTSFSISFKRDTYRDLTLRVVSPQKLVEDSASNIRDNPTDPVITETGRPYVQLKQGETLNGITTSFEAYSRLHYGQYNADIMIDWKWVPNNAAHQKNVEIQPKQNSTSLVLFSVTPAPEDMYGKLVAAVSYKNNVATYTSKSVEIPVRIYGSGIPPKLTPLEKWTGDPVRDSGNNPRREAITEMPKTMDVYQGNANIQYYKQEPRGPYRFTGHVNFGQSRGHAEYMIVRKLAGLDGAVELFSGGSAVAYKWGSQIDDPGGNLGFEVLAAEAGQIQLQFEFYNAAGEEMRQSRITHQINVYDSRPKADSKLQSLDLLGFNTDRATNDKLKQIYPNSVMTSAVDSAVNYTFAPDTNEYMSISVPYAVEEIQLRPTVPTASGASTEIKVEVLGGTTEQVKNGSLTKKIPLTVRVPKTIYVTVTAQDGSTNTYTLRVERRLRDGNFFLKSLEAYRVDDATKNEIENFERAKFDYYVTVDYNVDKLRVTAEPDSPWATVSIEPKPKRSGMLFWRSEEYVPLNGRYNPSTGQMEDGVTNITATVTAEDGSIKQYTVRVTRKPPDDTRTLDGLRVIGEDGKEIPFVDNRNQPMVFDGKQRDYVINIPYSASKLSVEALSKTATTQSFALTQPKVYGGKTDTRNFINVDTYVAWAALDIAQATKRDPARDEFTYNIQVKAESGRETDPPYTIRVRRADPDQYDDLTNIKLENQDGVDVTNTTQGYNFSPEILEYKFSVPYLTQSLKITPEPRSQLASVTVNGTKMTTQKNFLTVPLDTSKATKVTIVVTAESGTTRTYEMTITRAKPSTEARLANLAVSAGEMKPVFNPSKLAYSVRLPKGVRSLTVTPTAADQYASISVDGKPVISASPSETITPLEANTKINVVVTAQDGKTKRTYTIAVTVDDLVPKNSNADLRSLKVTPADMNPKFKPGHMEYEVYVKNETYNIEFEPITSDSHAKVEVYNGTRRIRDYDGNFTSSLIEDENEFEIVVTASDGTQKTYDFIVYRNNEEKQGAMQPITAETIDFTQENPIVIAIQKHSVVSADVFNTLRTDFPDKTIIFEGNDYTLEVNGKDLKRLVPSTEVFDLALSFSSPEEEDILALMSEDTRNQELKPVMVYFRHHGALPAPMKLTLSLGREYRNSNMTWNYYNEERERIDYYGNISTNVRGTFAVKLTHMSSYFTTIRRVVGSEDRSGSGIGEPTTVTTVGNYNISMTDGKENPNTGVGCE